MLFFPLDQVLKSIQNIGDTKPFALSEQYKSTWKKRKADEAVEPKPKAASKVKKPSSSSSNTGTSSCGSSGVYTPQLFAAMRVEYMNKLKEGRLSHREASQKWQDSEEKKNLLKDLPVSELIRRRFVPKGTTTNPFA